VRVLPNMDTSNAWLLPPSAEPYTATFEEIHDRFVLGAPFAVDRQAVFDALFLYAKLIWQIIPDARLRINGGFVTHKSWAAPADVDIAVVCPTISQDQLDRATSAPLFTLLNVSGEIAKSRVTIAKLHLMGGLVDAFPILPALPATDALFRRIWAMVKGEDGTITPGLTKGYIEVSNPDA
jgi:hypothetical protein